MRGRRRYRTMTLLVAGLLAVGPAAGCTATDAPAGSPVDQLRDLTGTFATEDGSFEVTLTEDEEFSATGIPGGLVERRLEGEPVDGSGDWELQHGTVMLSLVRPDSDEIWRTLPATLDGTDELALGDDDAITLTRVD